MFVDMFIVYMLFRLSLYHDVNNDVMNIGRESYDMLITHNVLILFSVFC